MYPTIFCLHGIGHTENHMLQVVEDLKDECILIGIRGHLPYENGYCYYELKGYGNPVRPLFDKAVDKLIDFMEDISNKYPIDPQQRYLIGFSQGAILSMTLALMLGEKIKGIVPMNGYIPNFVKKEYPIKSIEHLSVFHCQGDTDPIFPLHIGFENDTYLRKNAHKVKCSIYPNGHKISENAKQDVINWLRYEISQATRHPYKI